MLRTVKVYGHLAEHCGQSVFEALVRVPADAIKFLLCNFPELRGLMRDGYYKVAVGKYDLQLADHPEQLHYPMAADDVVKVIPVVSGAGGRGVGQILLGAALIGVAVFLAPAGLLVWRQVVNRFFRSYWHRIFGIGFCRSWQPWSCFGAWWYCNDDHACATAGNTR